MQGYPVGAGYVVTSPKIPELPRLFATEQEAREYYEDENDS